MGCVCLGFVWGFGVRVYGFGFRVQGLGLSGVFRVFEAGGFFFRFFQKGLGFRVYKGFYGFGAFLCV